MKFTLAVAGFALQAAAFPFVLEQVQQATEKRQIGVPSLEVARQLSASRTNCGVIPCTGFDAKEQFVSTSGEHAYASPAADEIRGPCPGLNAAANHGYLTRSGVQTIQSTIDGLGAAYGLAPDASAFLSVYAIIFDGDVLQGTWSIGGPQQSSSLTKSILGKPQGLSYSHNVYEGDASIGRQDAFLNNGDAHSLDVNRFATAYAVGLENNSYTLDLFAAHFLENAKWSEANNPYYFAAPFSTTIVSPAAYNFVINFMSNHSAETPGGYLDGEQFKQFFAVRGDYPDFEWLPGQERIPENWYRRPAINGYGLKDIGADLAVNWLAYPDSLRLGGNINGVNTYTGIDLGDLTGGLFQITDLLDTSGTNSTCFIAQLLQAIIPDSASLLLSEVNAITNLVNEFVKPITGNLSCTEVGKYDQTLFNQFPGYTYSPSGPSTNY